MSYDVELVDSGGAPLPSPEHFAEGGTFCTDGTSFCELNITYNYAEVFGGLVRGLNGRMAADTIPELKAFLALWPTCKPYDRDYWAPTPGNACQAIKRLLSFAIAHGTGKWRIT